MSCLSLQASKVQENGASFGFRRLIQGLLRGGGIEQKRKRERERKKELMGMDNSVVIAGSRGKGDE